MEVEVDAVDVELEGAFELVEDGLDVEVVTWDTDEV